MTWLLYVCVCVREWRVCVRTQSAYKFDLMQSEWQVWQKFINGTHCSYQSHWPMSFHTRWYRPAANININGMFECTWLSFPLQLSMPMQNSHVIIQRHERGKSVALLLLRFCSAMCYGMLLWQKSCDWNSDLNQEKYFIFVTVTVTSNVLII